MTTELRKTAEFYAKDDKGNEYIVFEYREFMERVRPGQPSEWIMKERIQLRLADGSPVNQIDANTFKVVHIDQIIRKV